MTAIAQRLSEDKELGIIGFDSFAIDGMAKPRPESDGLANTSNRLPCSNIPFSC